ncbi:MAG: electron transfer flavoprotein subunit beta/FixA family protein [Endomicrobiales bacterium]|nr:electron transfer flavoprotein subunit beta/FixA family protein [Endomicrobiales bacterium]
MHFIVCIKQVPNTTNVQLDPTTNTLKREGVESIINPFDEYAIEEAVRLKERTGGKTTVITMGPPQAENILREALARGIDNAILVSDRAFAGADTWATAYTLATAIKKIGDYSLILTGKQATDGDTAQVGPGVAEMLDIPHVAYVRKIEEITTNTIRVERMMEDGYDIIEMPLPSLISVVKEINKPRLPSLKGMMASKKAIITKWTAQDIGADTSKIGLTGSPTQVMKVFTPVARGGGEKLEGSPEEIAQKLIGKLKGLI